jgi:chromosome segregation ATPase
VIEPVHSCCRDSRAELSSPLPFATRQIAELESLCAAQQSSLEEAEERLRRLADSRDSLRHASLQTKAQLVTAQAQVGKGGGFAAG